VSWTVWTHGQIPKVFDRLHEAIDCVEAMLPGFEAVPGPDRLFCYSDNAIDWFERSAVIVHSDDDRTATVEHIRRMGAEQIAERRSKGGLSAGGIGIRPRVDAFDLAAD
jgi:hypothetical protein